MLVLAGTNTAQLQCQLDPVRHNGPVGTGVRSQVCHTVSHIPALATKINICRDNRIIKQSHTLFDSFLSGPLFIRLFLLCHWLDWVKIFFCRKESDNVWSHRTYFLQIPDYHLRSECQAVPGMWYELCARCNISPHYRMSSPGCLGWQLHVYQWLDVRPGRTRITRATLHLRLTPRHGNESRHGLGLWARAESWDRADTRPRPPPGPRKTRSDSGYCRGRASRVSPV